ncbi:hypothetical protein ROZALSC1DRAFT_29730 [Rozella allomycis CSF55]|uniref:Spindle assembly abnormal protein 6 N-terminal domain-containing protein n=1 Tax=Rozella allomycis (strain CSF55) TaxID=988480 RepID=A0A075AXL5_ROZAC|nr:hypothetical protein O9G_002020 [Rozella allomycis CSF55]RKP18600.1 hypothetical protein ROZALSC1DRAFT_29730 [Rozella allomycis CSF55]|eukprot:EPZ34889.1 hypothetical protein O9G_002020 [Rozella allomycis CSF55]
MAEPDPIFLARPASSNTFAKSKGNNQVERTSAEPRSFNDLYLQSKLAEELVYSRELIFEVREFHDAGARQEPLQVRIYRLGSEKEPDGYRIEIIQAEDLFFHYQCIIQLNNYRALQNKQNITADFYQFLDICTRILDDCGNNDNFTAIFKFKNDGQAKIAFFQNLGYKYIELLSLDFQGSTDQEVKEHVKRSYKHLRSEYQQVKSRLAEVLNVVKAKNPSLLLYLQQSTNNYETNSGKRYGRS